ncbi:MAG: RICIN domain-containing protein [Oscillospiraceae bacterium]
MKIKQAVTKLMASLLAIALCITILPLSTSAKGASLQQLKQAYPQGMTDANNRFGYYVNNVRLAGECNGFCFNAARMLYGIDLYNAEQYWTYSPKHLNSIKPGDIIRYRSNSGYHTIMVTNINGDTVNIAEANYSIRMGVDYTRTMTKSQLLQRGVKWVVSVPYALETDASSDAYTIGETVKITANNGLNVRSGPASKYSVVKKLPKNTVITVTGYPIKSATDSYTWQYCPQYNGYVATKYLYHISGSIYPEGSFKLTPKCAPKSAIAIEGRSYSSGAKAWLWSLHNDEGCQTWRFQPVRTNSSTGEIYYAIINERSGLALDVNTQTCRLIQYEPHYGDNQLFKLVDVGNGYYRIESKLGYSLDIQAGSSDNGTDVMIWYNDNSDSAQMFKLLRQ